MSSQNLSATSLSAIESAIKLFDVKKDDLKKAFDHLQAHSVHPSSFSLSWSDLDAHFSAIQKSITQQFGLLQSRQSANNPVDAVPVLSRCSNHPVSPPALTRQDQPDSVTESMENQPLDQLVQFNAEQPSSSSNAFGGLTSDGLVPASSRIDPALTRSELKEFCENMDGKGLRKYINDHQKERESIRMELQGALKSAADPGAIVLDAMEGFYAENSRSKGNKDPEIVGLRRVCVFLLELLIEIGVTVSDEVRQRGKKLALEWKGKVGLSKDKSFEALAYLHLVAAYGLGAEVDKYELISYFVIAARYRQAAMLCRTIDLGEKVHDLIQKLLDGGKQLLAVRFAFEFGLIEKFPPVPLLKDYLKETEKLAKQVCKDGKNSLKSQNEATAKEIGALKAVIKVIEEHKLETEYPSESLQRCIEQLEKQQAERKRPPATPAANPAQQPPKKKKQAQGKQRQSDKKRSRTTTSVATSSRTTTSVATSSRTTTSVATSSRTTTSVAVATSAVHPFQQSHLHSANLMLDHSAAYMTSQAIPYGLAGSTPVVAPYGGSSAGLYSLAGGPMGFGMNPNPASLQIYSYDGLPTYGAYSLPPQYHPSYHPR